MEIEWGGCSGASQPLALSQGTRRGLFGSAASGEADGAGVFVCASLFNHSCSPACYADLSLRPRETEAATEAEAATAAARAYAEIHCMEADRCDGASGPYTHIIVSKSFPPPTDASKTKSKRQSVTKSS